MHTTLRPLFVSVALSLVACASAAPGDLDSQSTARELASTSTPEMVAFVPTETATCSGTTMVSFNMSVTPGVTTQFNYSCFPYVCTSSGAMATCGTSCTSNAGCAPGLVCASGACVTNASTCVPPAGAGPSTQEKSSLGYVYDCGVYACDSVVGQCLRACAQSADCKSGYVCDVGSHTCIP